jgi:hypothetical protein
MSVVELNFEVLAEFYQYCAYDSVAFGSFFSVLKNIMLGIPHHSVTELFSNRISGLNHIGQVDNCGRIMNACLLEEIQPEVPAPGGDAVPLGNMNEVANEAPAASEADLEVQNVRPEGFPRRRRKPAVSLNTSLLRRSARIETLNKGFIPNLGQKEASATSSGAAASAKSKGKGKAPMVLDGASYVGHTIPGAPPSPHLSLANAQAIGAGFCKMPPGAVSRETLLVGDNDSQNN